jgi:hypothetical protein
MAKEHLEIYLNDHLAGSVVALELLEDLEREGTGIKQVHELGHSHTALDRLL